MARSGAVSWYKSNNSRVQSKCGRFEIFPVMKIGQKSVASFTLIDRKHYQSYKKIQSQAECKNMADRIIKSENSESKEENSNTQKTKARTNKIKIKAFGNSTREKHTIGEDSLFILETWDGRQFDIFCDNFNGDIGIRARDGVIKVIPGVSNQISVENITLKEEMEKGRG